MSSSSSDESEERPPPKPDWFTDEDTSARSLVFLVTFAAILDATALAAEVPLRSLDGLSREDIKAAVLDAVEHPVQDANQRGGRPRTATMEAQKLVVFLEEPRHFHVALRLGAVSRFLPLKTALRRRAGLASHWSTSHTQWWSAVRYGVFTTAHKPAVDQAPLVWVKALGVLEPLQAGPGAVQEYKDPAAGNVVVNLYTRKRSNPSAPQSGPSAGNSARLQQPAKQLHLAGSPRPPSSHPWTSPLWFWRRTSARPALSSPTCKSTGRKLPSCTVCVTRSGCRSCSQEQSSGRMPSGSML